jgi:dipeptidyl aminopeptidase/acylaminoacyl peptidase
MRIAYVVSELDPAADTARSSIWLVPTRGGTSRRLTDNGSEPRWSPGGNQLAFISHAEGAAQLWVLPLDSGEPRRITDVSGGVTGPPVWSPDGRRVAFTARVFSGGQMQPDALQAAGVSSHLQTTAGAPRVIRRLRYLLNGSGYIGDEFWHVFTVAAGELSPAPAAQLTSGEWHHFSPSWSPDGRQLTCITTRRDDWDTEWVWDVYVLDAEESGTPPRRLTASRGTCAAPAWSPDGQWIAYFDNQCPGTAYTQDYDLWIAPASGGAARKVSGALQRGCQVSQPPASNEPPHWSADSTTLFFHVREAGFFHYYAYDLVADALRPVLASRDLEGPAAGWVRQSMDGGVLAICAASAVRPAELYACTPNGSNLRRLTGLNDAALEGLEVRAPERLTRTSPEGWEVESWLWLPPGHALSSAPLPAVLYFHGGPHNTVALGFNEQLHALAGAGFAVVGVNFRGSTGFGTAFADSILGDWGTRELDDGLAIVDALVKQGTIDAQRVGVYGGSYGGFMTNLALARTDRFAAGVSFATISGLETWSYVTDHWESVDWDSGGPPWQIPEYYRTHSPLTYVADIRAPLLILHGEEDYRCSVTEADQLFGALRKLKRTVELVRYPGGSHAFAHIGPPSHRLDAMRRVVDWFSRYL